MKRIVFAAIILFLLQYTANADLFEYIAKEDASYKWEKIDQENLPNEAVKIGLRLTSQTWQDIVL